MIKEFLLRIKTLAIVKKHFAYDPFENEAQAQAFDVSTATIKRQGGNQFDAAIAFMLIQLDQLDASDLGSFRFRYDLVNMAFHLSSKCKLQPTRDVTLELYDIYHEQVSQFENRRED